MNLNEVQKLEGMIAALNRFVSRSTDKCLPFFQVLKKAREWDAKCEEVFSQLKEYLVKPPLLSHTKLGEPLSLFLVVTPDVVFAALVLQKPDTLGQLVKWSIELSEYDINYIPKSAVKGSLSRDLVAASSRHFLFSGRRHIRMLGVNTPSGWRRGGNPPARADAQPWPE
ncbi:uncharacterized protein LOC121265873 [Juglans microcarpa x Juglans regia]|uniref:uncharacterized protein LOC121265873 n=1 Tax=Juglans microcarpa x Juglans regia TaxID=2249226 RepID=UPI001B7F2093|nr:uncharacterized protein LOC121265873 [Juglans microcarpa x Juglans regia]